MKNKKTVLIFVLFMMLFTLVSCELAPATPVDGHKVVFNTNGGNFIKNLVLNEDSTIELPTPTKEGYNFYGWFIDEELTMEFDSSTIVTGDITLYAAWRDGYIIRTLEDLDAIRNDLTAKYYLANDINCLNIKFNTAAQSADTPFTGLFDGQGHTLYNFNLLANDDSTYIGLIGYNQGTVTNLTIKDAVIEYKNNFTSPLVYSGIIVGLNEGEISKCEVINASLSCTKTGNSTYTEKGAVRQGLICGRNAGTVSNCLVIGEATLVNKELKNIDSNTYTYIRCGGVSGENLGLIENCFANVNISCTGYFADYVGKFFVDDGNVGESGAIAAVNEENAEINNCLIMGSIYANFHDGDVVNRNSGLIKNSYRLASMDTSELYRVHATVANEESVVSPDFYSVGLGWDNAIWNYTDVDFNNEKYPSLIH